MFGQASRALRKRRVHRLRRFAHAEPAERVTGEVHRDQFPRAFSAEVEVQPALHDGELRLVGSRVVPLAALGPQDRSRDRGPHLRRVGVGRRALVEYHRDVRAEVLLNLDGSFGREFERGAVDVASELRPVVGDLHLPREAEHLEPAGVGEDRAVPVHELV